MGQIGDYCADSFFLWLRHEIALADKEGWSERKQALEDAMDEFLFYFEDEIKPYLLEGNK